jgi:hypothetical protein
LAKGSLGFLDLAQSRLLLVKDDFGLERSEAIHWTEDGLDWVSLDLAMDEIEDLSNSRFFNFRDHFF